MRTLPSILSLFALAACHPIANDTEAKLTASGELVALSGGGAGARNACFSCHGLDGLGDGDAPRLAGMDVGYLQKQMEDYGRDLRHDDVMSPIARRLTDGERRSVVAWYAAMSVPASAFRDATPVPALFQRGDPERGVVACAACHGDQGQGAGAGNPALAGQPAAYTLEQLRRWKKTARRNDPRGVMTAAVAPLTDDEMRRIADWLQTRSPARAPDSGVASASVSATAAAEPAASRGTRHPDR
ncbi:MAG: c-type cytochrome [Brevundimonas sp.]|nr:MAG: c-type cytochrome [Brevundimonas sp.]